MKHHEAYLKPRGAMLALLPNQEARLAEALMQIENILCQRHESVMLEYLRCPFYRPIMNNKLLHLMIDLVQDMIKVHKIKEKAFSKL